MKRQDHDTALELMNSNRKFSRWVSRVLQQIGRDRDNGEIGDKTLQDYLDLCRAWPPCMEQAVYLCCEALCDWLPVKPFLTPLAVVQLKKNVWLIGRPKTKERSEP